MKRIMSRLFNRNFSLYTAAGTLRVHGIPDLSYEVTKACSTCPSKTVRLTYVNRMRLTDRKEMYNYVLAPAHACVVTYGKKIRRMRRSDRTEMFVPSVKTDAMPERNSQRMTSGFGNSQRMMSGFEKWKWRAYIGPLWTHICRVFFLSHVSYNIMLCLWSQASPGPQVRPVARGGGSDAPPQLPIPKILFHPLA